MAGVFFVWLPADKCTGPYWWQVDIGSGNGLAPSGRQVKINISKELQENNIKWPIQTMQSKMYLHLLENSN